MSIIVLDNFLSHSECEFISQEFDKLCIPDPELYGYFHTPGFTVMHNGLELSLENPVLELSDNQDKNKASLLATTSILNLKSNAEKYFNYSLNVVNAGYVQMHAGSNNGLHADVAHLDGSAYEDGRHVDYSGIIYLNESYVDFSGGTIIFPNQGVSIKPKVGMAILFKGDMDHTHAVKTVTSGIRKNMVLFFGIK
jgi:hypothetical protein